MSYYSPIYSRSTYTPSSSGTGGIHYFNNSPTHEAQMWPASNAALTSANDEYGSPKGGLPAFQRLTSSNAHYAPAGRTANHYNYGSQVSDRIVHAVECIDCVRNIVFMLRIMKDKVFWYFVFFFLLSNLVSDYRTLGSITMTPIILRTIAQRPRWAIAMPVPLICQLRRRYQPVSYSDSSFSSYTRF